MTRYPLLLAAVCGALTLGACGGAKNSNGVASASADDKAFEGAVKFSRCMRQHGVDMPDPVRAPDGGIRIGGPSAKRLKNQAPDPKLRTAQAACQKYLEAGSGGRPMDPAQQARFQDAFFAYARCMRGKGIEMPDPKVTSRGVQMRVGGPGGKPGANPDSPVFKAADTACHHFLAQIDKFKSGGKGGPSLHTESK